MLLIFQKETVFYPIRSAYPILPDKLALTCVRGSVESFQTETMQFITRNSRNISDEDEPKAKKNKWEKLAALITCPCYAQHWQEKCLEFVSCCHATLLNLAKKVVPPEDIGFSALCEEHEAEEAINICRQGVDE